MLIGCDVEFAVVKDGNLIPAGVLPCEGIKGKPQIISTGGVEIDGVSLELTMEPDSNSERFVKRLFQHIEVTQKFFDVKLVPASNMFYTEKDLEVRFAGVLGCSFDYNVYTGKQQAGKIVKDSPTMRTFGGHIHLECRERVNVVKWMDIFVGVFSTVHWNDRERKRMYGKAGSFRPKPYGIEYRVPSSMWTSDQSLALEIINLSRKAVERQDESPSKELSAKAIKIINSCSAKQAREFLHANCA